MRMTETEVRQVIRQSLSKRYRKERRFYRTGALAISVGVLFLLWLFGTNAYQASDAFLQTYIGLDIPLNVDQFGGEQASTEVRQQAVSSANYNKIIKSALRTIFPDASTRKQKAELYRLISSGAEYNLRDRMLRSPHLAETESGTVHQIWLLADDEIDMYMKGKIDPNLPNANRRLSERTIARIDRLRAEGRIKKRFNMPFFTAGDSRDAEQAGIWGALKGSIFTMMVTMLLALPIGIAAAIYLQEFAPKNNKLVDFVEVNINNLAAVPSIIFGLLGLAVLINFFGLSRSVPLVGGMVLALMTLPAIVIASRAALGAVPASIRQAALGVGASSVQTVVDHVLPLALPGILTGSILGLARALGETAPLLVIGMVAFIVDVPSGPNDPATVLPVQIYLWADSPERAFVERTSAAIFVLLILLALITGLIALLRNKLEIRNR